MGSEAEIGVEGSIDVENTVFVAVGKNVKESKSTLLWALEYFAGRKLCVLHVHQPAQFLNFIDEKVSSSKLKQQAIKAYRELERQKMHKLLNQYLIVLNQVEACKMWIEWENVEEGIVEVVAQQHIRWLVMGAATEKHYSKNLSELKSQKAIHVCRRAPVYCQIWFPCKGLLICSRPANVTSKIERIETLSSKKNTRGTSLQQNYTLEAYEYDESMSLEHQNKRTDEVVGTLTSTPLLMDGIKEDGSSILSLNEPHDSLLRSLSADLLEERPSGQVASDLYHKIEKATILAENSKQEAFEESVRRWKAEEDAMEDVRKAELLASICMKETNRREELEEMLVMQRQELERMKHQHDQCVEDLQAVKEQKPVIESQITESHRMEKELEEKIIQAVDLLIKFKEQRDELQIECEVAAREVNKLKNLVEKDIVGVSCSQFFVFSFLEIFEATRNFDLSWKIGEGKSGCVYKGLLRHVKVAIKMLPSLGSQSDLEFENEAGVLSRVRHPNLVQLVGICPESRSLIYEYCENGNLEDRLVCQGKTPPLPWQSRVRMIIEICSGLVFLQSSNPCIVHGNIKLTNILLDANYVCKLSCVGLFRLICREAGTVNGNTIYKSVGPEASVYMDPEFYETGELTAESDVYSFGIVLLQLLTGRKQAFGIAKDVKCALGNGNFNTVLDFSAGDWPLELAKQLAHLAIGCCENKRLNRPNFISDVWTLIEPMRNLCTPSSLNTDGKRRVPSHFCCPIFQEVMKDPYIAADGFTYEADAIKGWLNSGHKTSPMTNLKLDHCDLLPNSALYYAIQEWQQQS